MPKRRKDILRLNVHNVEKQEQENIRSIFKINCINLNDFVISVLRKKVKELESK